MFWSFACHSLCLLSHSLPCHWFGTEIATVTDMLFWVDFFFFLCCNQNHAHLLCKWIGWFSKPALPLNNYHGNPAGMEDGSNPRPECHSLPQFLPVVLQFFMSNHFFIFFMFLIKFQSSPVVVLTVSLVILLSFGRAFADPCILPYLNSFPFRLTFITKTTEMLWNPSSFFLHSQ